MTIATFSKNPFDSLIDSCIFPHDAHRDISIIVSDYVMRRPELFGGNEYFKYLNKRVESPELCAEFFSFWNSYDAFDLCQNLPASLLRYNYETHLDPIYRPIDMPLETLSSLVATPLNGGHPTTFKASEGFEQNAHTSAEHGAWLVPRKGVVARDQLYDRQKEFISDVNRRTGAKYERENDLIDLATCAAVWYVFKGERLLAGEGRLTFARCKDTVCDNKGTKYRLAVVNSGPSSLTIYHSFETASEAHGVLALRKFPDTLKDG